MLDRVASPEAAVGIRAVPADQLVVSVESFECTPSERDAPPR